MTRYNHLNMTSYLFPIHLLEETSSKATDPQMQKKVLQTEKTNF